MAKLSCVLFTKPYAAPRCVAESSDRKVGRVLRSSMEYGAAVVSAGINDE
jgi:hypothetical protein